MRYVLIDPRNRQAWNQSVPVQLDEAYICHVLRCDELRREPMIDDVDLWLSAEPKCTSFALQADGPTYHGYGFLCGRTKLDDIKSLPLRWNMDMIERMVIWPQIETTASLLRAA